jgi:hypothetical protein
MKCLSPGSVPFLVSKQCPFGPLLFEKWLVSAMLFFFFFFFFLVFRDRVSLCSSGCPGTHSVDQAGLELRNPPASASQVLGLKACATTPGLNLFLWALVFCLCVYVRVSSDLGVTDNCELPCGCLDLNL